MILDYLPPSPFILWIQWRLFHQDRLVKGKENMIVKKEKTSTVLGILPNSHIMSVRICIKLLYRKQMETEASLHPSACAQRAVKVLMWKPARTYKRIKNFESKALRKNWLCEALLFLLNQFRAYERCRTDRPNSFLNTQNRCSKRWFLSFLHCTSAFQPWLRETAFGQREEFIFQACAFFPPCVDCQQRHQLVHSPSIWSKWNRDNRIKGEMCLLLEFWFDIYFGF